MSVCQFLPELQQSAKRKQLDGVTNSSYFSIDCFYERRENTSGGRREKGIKAGDKG